VLSREVMPAPAKPQLRRLRLVLCGLAAALSLPALATPAAASSGVFSYYGGRVLGSPQVVQVLYGSGTYSSTVAGTVSPNIATFYTGILKSPYVDWLSEYNTPAAPNGTGQSIGRGAFAGRYQITPAVSGGTVDDTQVQTELKSQIAQGHLPSPALDAAGNPRTMYAVQFPHGLQVTQGGVGQALACAFHGAVAAGQTQEFYYTLIPDLEPQTPGGDGQCGGSSTFETETIVSSQQLLDVMTNPEGPLSSSATAPPTGWYDFNDGYDVADYCAAQAAAVYGSDGIAYMVTRGYSDQASNCVIEGPSVGDFSLTLQPVAQTLATGSEITYTVHTATTAGSPQALSLSVSGVPAGVSASLTPNTVTGGGSSTLTLAAAPGATTGTTTITVTGTAASGSHNATASLTVTARGASPSSIRNGGFESGSLSGWTVHGTATAVNSGAASGTWAAQLGSSTTATGSSSIAQSFTAPASTTGITYQYRMTCHDTVAHDWTTATLRDNTSRATLTMLRPRCITDSSYVTVAAPVISGHGYTLTIINRDDGNSSNPSWTLVDNVQLISTAPRGIVNGGFETANLFGWVTAGPSAAVVRGGAQAGLYALRLGSTVPSSGESTATQVFITPTGTSTLSYWYRMSCPDGVLYDWSSASLTDYTSGTTSAVQANTCSKDAAWVNVSAPLTAGHTYSLTLLSRDDGYPSDGSYTLFDSVTVH